MVPTSQGEGLLPPSWSPSRPRPSFLPPTPCPALGPGPSQVVGAAHVRGPRSDAFLLPGCRLPPQTTMAAVAYKPLPPPGCGCCGRPQALRTHLEDWGSWASSRHLQEDSRRPGSRGWRRGHSRAVFQAKGRAVRGGWLRPSPASRMGPLHPPSWSLRLSPCPVESPGILHCLYFCGGPGPTFSWLQLPTERSGRGLTWRPELPWVGGLVLLRAAPLDSHGLQDITALKDRCIWSGAGSPGWGGGQKGLLRGGALFSVRGLRCCRHVWGQDQEQRPALSPIRLLQPRGL